LWPEWVDHLPPSTRRISSPIIKVWQIIDFSELRCDKSFQLYKHLHPRTLNEIEIIIKKDVHSTKLIAVTTVQLTASIYTVKRWNFVGPNIAYPYPSRFNAAADCLRGYSRTWRPILWGQPHKVLWIVCYPCPIWTQAHALVSRNLRIYDTGRRT
jgi:hypothetical protein